MTHLVIGGDGKIGKALCRELCAQGVEYRSTTRRRWAAFDGKLFLDLYDLKIGLDELGNPNTVYLVAAMSGMIVGKDSESYRINVDAQIKLARYYSQQDTFVVFISSDAVEFPDQSAYARQKAAVEAYIQSIDGAIVRPTRIAPERIEEFAGLVVDIGVNRIVGVTRWV
jgi:nucleoside-diphosphate-sugar epimerase